MNKHDGKRSPSPAKSSEPGDPGSERRRMGRIVHDDRGAASVEWRDAPDDYERPVLKIEGTGVAAPPPLSIKNDDTFNPYDRAPEGGLGGSAPPRSGGKRDLKKLSEWIKLMREMEERKKKGDSEE